MNYDWNFSDYSKKSKWMEKIWDLINFSIDKYWLWDISQSLIIFWRFKFHLAEIMWENSLKFCECEKFQNWYLFVKWKNSAWSNELQVLNYEILEKMRKDFWREKIKWIKIIN